MKTKLSRFVFVPVLVLGMLFLWMPAAVSAATAITPSPAQNQGTALNVEYFTSTLYNWDEEKANAATAAADSNQGRGFYFTDSGSKPADSRVPAYSKWISTSDNKGIAAQNYYIYSGLAAERLSESDNKPFSVSVNAANLFAADGSNTGYTDVYTNVQVPFVLDEDGYYTLDSDAYAVYFQGSASSDSTMSIADLPVAYSWQSYYVTGFQPFRDISGQEKTIRNAVKSAVSLNSSNANTKAYTTSASYGFGMVTSVDFQMTDDGRDVNGKDITFQFSGDDDVWVYVDGVLALDIGGTHDAVKGTINFATGDVTLTTSYGRIADKRTDENMSGCNRAGASLSQTNLYTALGTTLTGFASSGRHTLTIYYMDRGKGRTNCLIKFNLPQKDSVSVTKTIHNNYITVNPDGSKKITETAISEDVLAALNNVDFSFTLYNDNSTVAGKSYSVYDSGGSLVGTGTTDSLGGFMLKAGQTAAFKNISLDAEGTSYHVAENTSGLSSGWYGVPSWTASSNVAGAGYTEGMNGDSTVSGTVTVTGASTSTDTIDFTFTNYYIYTADLNVDAADDTVVIDYGLADEIDVVGHNDNVTNNGTAVRNYMLAIADADGGYSDNVAGTYGVAEVRDGKIVYTLTGQMSGIETFTYKVTAEDETADKTAEDTAVLTIIPATSMYYEENFSDMVKYSNGTVKWESVSDNKTYGGYQETGFVGTRDDSTYGTDAVYLNNLGDSYGTSMYANAVGAAGVQFEYDFTGTGTAIYGRISDNTGYIQVTITREDGSRADIQNIDTRVIGKVAASTVLYQVPIYNNDGLDYGTYHVRVYMYHGGTLVGSSGSAEVSAYSGSEFYLDGIRVYEPLGNKAHNAGNAYVIAGSAYGTDGESNTAIINIREKTRSDSAGGYLGEIFTLTDINSEIEEAETYIDIGPNEELYLYGDAYCINFALVGWESQSYKLYLGMKAPDGETASVDFVKAAGDDEAEDETLGNVSINNSADCYYDISSYVVSETLDDNTVVGYVTIRGNGGLAALTNIKVTGIDTFQLGYAEDIEENGEIAPQTLYAVSRSYADSLKENAGEEMEVFAPERVKASITYASKTKKATVNVVTSDDVAYATINGVKVSPKTTITSYKFSKSYTKVAAGTTYEIVLYNKEELASETYVVTAR